jgi:hypothetical protein
MEIDVMVVTDDRVLILEIKDWNGKLTSKNNCWWIKGQNRGRSAVVQVGEKARKLKAVLKSELGAAGSKLYVDQRVVLTGLSTRDALPAEEKKFIWTLSEACSIGHGTTHTALLDPVRLTMFKAYQFESDFDRVVGNTKFFLPSEADWSGYQVKEQDLFVHPRGVWHDHLAEQRSEKRLKALVRIWHFDKLSVGLNCAEHRRLVAQRETNAFAYLQDRGSELATRNRLLREIGTPPDEILTNHHEVRAIAQGWSTLDRYLERVRDDLSIQDRVVIASGLLNLVSQMHSAQMTHRDLGARAIWIGSPSEMAMTGLMSCQLPDQDSVMDWLTELRGYAPQIPEDRNPAIHSTGYQRDVYMCGYLVAMVLTGIRPDGDPEVTAGRLPEDMKMLQVWLTRGLSSDPAARFVNATQMMEEFSGLIEPRQPVGIDQSLIDRFETPGIIPYVRWTMASQLASKTGCTVYTAHDEAHGQVTVKVWNGLRRGESASIDLSLLRLLDSASRLKTSPIKGLPKFVALGLSPVGPFVVYEHCQGIPVNEVAGLAEIDALRVAYDILSAVAALHDMGCDHGDISFSNVIVDQSTTSVWIVDSFDISPVGNGSIRTPALCPPNWERLSQAAIDRYAALKVVFDLLSRHSSEALQPVIELLKQEITRPIIESLEVATVEINRMIHSATKPPLQRIQILTREDTCGFVGGRGFFVQREPVGTDQERFTVTNATGQMLIEGDGINVRNLRFHKAQFTALAHESRFGTMVDFQLLVSPGNDTGLDDLYQQLRNEVGSPLSGDLSARPASASKEFKVERHWRRLMELEEEARVEITITDIVASRDGVVVCRCENVGKEFDFDDEDTIEVFNAANKRIGEVEHSLSDFPSTVAIRGEGRRIALGDNLRLVDRRDQASIDRRMKAVDRILDGRAAIPDLIDYFAPDADVESVDFGAEISEDDLGRYALNNGQQAAFRNLLCHGPIGLLQGPPGTGKTRFIASFVHWLLTQGGSQRILIASQSHEAVNNVIDSLLLLYKKLGGKPNLLRIGSKGITERIKPYHSAELRERYRVRFEAAAKYRFSQLTSAKGISRVFASELFDLDQSIGILARRCAALQDLAVKEDESLKVDRERNLTQLSRTESALVSTAKQVLARDIDPKRPLDELELAIRTLADKHADVSPADVSAARRIMELTHDWLSSLASPQRNFEEFLAKTRSVVTATCVGVGQTRIRIDSQVFDWVIVDEAARCTPGELAVPIQMARRVLLVGDHLQLKPMIVRDLLDRLGEDMPGIDRKQLAISDFERAFTSPYGHQVGRRFTEQYRMDPAICRVVSKCFYEPHSVSLTTSLQRVSEWPVISSDARVWLAKPMTWVDTSAHPRAREVRPVDTTTRYNDAEVEAVILLLESIAADSNLVAHLTRGDDETPIGVICMYAGQKRRIEMAWARHAWEPKFRNLVRIDTVDSYQGKENAIAILSLVSSNPIRDVGHVGSPNRCNVAVSRAKERLAIVGALSMWESVPDRSPMAMVLAQMKKDPDNVSIIKMGELG